MDKIKKTLTEIARVVLGLTFIFSGFVKSIDPYGTAYKVADYLTAFNLSSLSFLEMPISFFLCGFEMALGIVVLLGLFPKWSSKLILLTMCFMTPLTLYLAIANPVSDCGCFGDALVISNWETFYKNIVLLILTIWFTIDYKSIKPFFTDKMQKWGLGFITLFSLLFLFYNYIYDPLIDFRPYKRGVNLPQQMTVDESKLPVMENIFIYEKEGINKEFTEDNYPWEDSTWVFVSMDTKVIKEGELPPISDFGINQIIFNKDNTAISDQYDITQDVIHEGNYTFIVLAPKLDKITESDKGKFNAIAEYAQKNDYSIYLLTASTTNEIIKAKQSFNNEVRFCTSDEKVLKTIIRSNPGLLLIKDGNILGKWGNAMMPNKSELNKPIEQIIADNTSDMSNGMKILIVALLLLIPLGIMKRIDIKN